MDIWEKKKTRGGQWVSLGAEEGEVLAVPQSASISTTAALHCGPVCVCSMSLTTNSMDWLVRHGAPPYCSPLSLCTGRSLCPTGWGPGPPCSPDSAPWEAASPAPAFYMCLAGSGRIWPGCKPWVSSIDGCRLCTGRTWTPVHLWSRWPPPLAWSRKAIPGSLRDRGRDRKETCAQVKHGLNWTQSSIKITNFNVLIV